jgi:5-methylcytosine-specific restriction endonuclease McrA
MGNHHSKRSQSRNQLVLIPPPILNPVVPKQTFQLNSAQIVISGPSIKINTRKENTTSRKPTKSKESKHKRDRIPQDIRNNVWMTYHGDNSVGVCYCCGTTIQRYNAGWHCSHVISDIKGGQETVDNLRTCCKHCNLSMGDQNLYVYIRDKGLAGPGSKNVNSYLQRHYSQINDKRTNNWGRSGKQK